MVIRIWVLFLYTVLCIRSLDTSGPIPHREYAAPFSGPCCTSNSTSAFLTSPAIDENLLEVEIRPNARLKTEEELCLEYIIEKAYQRCLRTYEIKEKAIVLRIPFGQNGERQGSPKFYQYIYLGGKGDPEDIWPQVDSLLASVEFAEYLDRISQPGEKLILFDLEEKNYSIYDDKQLIEAMKEGPYPGTRVRVFVLKRDSSISEVDIYNYLYCVGAVGMDCSGFIYYIQKSIARAYGIDLDGILAIVWNSSLKNVPKLLGLWFFKPEEGNVERVDDKISNLRPGDIFLFKGRGYIFRHSAVIQSIDLHRGVIRYVQCTDWAPQRERGVHESFIYFDPAQPGISLKDEALEWSQKINPTFIGEVPLRFWKDDGDRYRSYMEAGGSVIVRLKLIKEIIEHSEPAFYRRVNGYSGAILLLQ